MKRHVDWHICQLGDIGRVVTGRTPSSGEEAAFGDEYPFITPSDMDGRRKIDTTERYLSKKGASLIASSQVPARSVAVSCIGWQMGKTVLTTRTSFTNQQLNTIIPNSRVVPEFLYYALSTRQTELKNLGSGGARTPILNKSRFETFPVRMPPLPIQERIVEILSAYDDLIENNIKRLKIFEEMARAVYHEWFVNFRFPGYGKTRIVDSPHGQLPIGWEAVKLRDLLELRKDVTKAGSHLADRKYVPIECLPRNSLAIVEAEPWQEAQSSLQLFEPGDVLFGAMRAYFHKVALAPFRGVTRTTAFVLRPRGTNFRAYSLMTTFREETVAYANSHSRGATIPYAVWDNSLSELQVILPSKRIVERFESHCGPLLDWICLMYDRQRALREARDLLLPRLISGEIDVSSLPLPPPA